MNVTLTTKPNVLGQQLHEQGTPVVAAICLVTLDAFAAPGDAFHSNLMSSFSSEAHDVTLDVETPAEAYAVKPIVLHVTLRNKTPYDVSWEETNAEYDLGIRIRDDEGQLIPLTARGKEGWLGVYDAATNSIHSRFTADSHTGTLHSRQSAQWNIILSDFFIVHPGGHYHVEVSKSMQVEDTYNQGFTIAIPDLPFWVLKD